MMLVSRLVQTLVKQPGTLMCTENTSRLLDRRQHLLNIGRRAIFLNSSKAFDNYEEHRAMMKNAQLPEYFNFARDVIDRWARSEQTETKKSVPALWWVDDKGNELKWSFQELSKLSKRFANVLVKDCGLVPGDIAIVILPKIPEWWAITMGTIRSGIVMSSGTTLLRPKDIKHRFRASQAKCIITDKSSVKNVLEVLDDCESVKVKIYLGEKSETPPGWLNYGELMEKANRNFETIKSKALDPMMIFFTSGTTGYPKMTEHPHGYGLGQLLTARYLYEINDGDILWALSDTGWAKAAYGYLSPWLRGAGIFVYNSPAFDPLETLQIIQKYRPTHFCAPPTAVRLMIKEKLLAYPYLKDMKRIISAGEPVNPELIDVWKEMTGHHIYEGYGQSETVLLCGTSSCVPYKPGSMGRASPGIDLQIVDDEGNIVPEGTEGNIGVRYKPHRPLGLFTRYIHDEDRMKAVFKGDFYLTGDRGYMDEDKYIFFVGRADDVIITSGYRIGPFEVESALLEHPAVLESAVVSSPDDVRGEVVKAFVILTPSYKNADKRELIKELQDHVKKITAPYKYPRKIEFVDELPKTISGKIRRIELRNKEWGKETPDLAPDVVPP